MGHLVMQWTMYDLNVILEMSYVEDGTKYIKSFNGQFENIFVM